MTALRLPVLETPCSGKGSQADNPHPFVLLKIYMLLGKEKKKNWQQVGKVALVLGNS